MGLKADETKSLSFEELLGYLRSKTRVFMDVDDGSTTSRTPTAIGACRIARS